MKLTDKLNEGMNWLETASAKIAYPVITLAFVFIFMAAQTLLNGV